MLACPVQSLSIPHHETLKLAWRQTCRSRAGWEPMQVRGGSTRRRCWLAALRTPTS